LTTVLLTCAGRRTSLLSLFRDAVRPSGGRVLAADLDPLAPTMLQADAAVEVPPVDDDAYVPALLDAVTTHDVDLVVPTIDPELPVLLDARDALADAGAHALISEAELLEVTGDKWRTVRHFAEAGFRTPASWRPGDAGEGALPDPVFVKPRRGSSSVGARAVPRRHLDAALDRVDAPILQEVVDAPEITVDALFDLHGTLLHYVPRLRIRTLAGESVQGRTLPEDVCGPWLQDVLGAAGDLGARGPLTLQAFLTDGEPTLSEINPRFGGGFPLAHAAGAHYPAWILEMIDAASPDDAPLSPRLGSYQPGLYMTRSFTEYFTTESDSSD
jgi:carbamoyl-phosphate synthase large subunit